MWTPSSLAVCVCGCGCVLWRHLGRKTLSERRRRTQLHLEWRFPRAEEEPTWRSLDTLPPPPVRFVVWSFRPPGKIGHQKTR